MAEVGQPLPLIGRDRVLIDKFSRELYDLVRGMEVSHSNVWELPRGNGFEVLLPSGHVAAVQVTLARFMPEQATDR